MKFLVGYLLCLIFAVTATARSVLESYNWKSAWHLPGRQVQDVPEMGNSTFEQLIDHNNPSLGTFSQFYYYSTEFWKGPGSPVVLFTVGLGRLQELPRIDSRTPLVKSSN